MSNNRLTGDPSVLVYGILSVSLPLYGYNYLYGLPTLIALCCGFAALIKANKNLKIYKQTPKTFKDKSLKVIKSGKILSIIGIILSTIILCILVIFLWLSQGESYIEF